MKYIYLVTIKNCYKAGLIGIFLAPMLFLSGCVGVAPPSKNTSNETELKKQMVLELTQYKQSPFKRVEATFFTHQPKELVFRVLTDVNKTAQWLDRIESLEVLEVYNNNQYLLRTVIDSPWPFKDRELISCVDTVFEKNHTTISIRACSDRVPINSGYVRLLQAQSNWTLSKTANASVEINYQTWIDPSGNVPAFIFNGELIDNTEVHLQKLQAILNKASLADYPY